MSDKKGKFWDQTSKTFLTWEEFMKIKHPKVDHNKSKIGNTVYKSVSSKKC